MVYFITEKYLKENTPIENGVDMTKVDFWMKTAYELYLRPLIGNQFSKYLLDKHQEVITGGDTYSNEEETLIDIVQPFIAWAVTKDSTISLNDALFNKGMQKQNGDYSTYSDNFSASKVATHYQTTYELYKTNLVDYLCENADLYPQFIAETNTNSLIKKSCTSCCGGVNTSLNDYGIHFI